MRTTGRSTSGYASWRLIADELRGEIVAGVTTAGSRLPSEAELAERFGVNRHTVRQAVAALAAEKLVVARRGSGTYVAEHSRLVHRIGVRTRLSDSIGPGGASAKGRLLECVVDENPPAEIVDVLRLDGRAALRLEDVRSVDGLPIAHGTSWFDAERVPHLVEHYGPDGSVTSALRAIGITDYTRVSTAVSARIATTAEAHELEIPAGSIVLLVRGLNALPDGTPFLYNDSRFVADRVELELTHSGR